jgi:hypothetical protein
LMQRSSTLAKICPVEKETISEALM